MLRTFFYTAKCPYGGVSYYDQHCSIIVLYYDLNIPCLYCVYCLIKHPYLLLKLLPLLRVRFIPCHPSWSDIFHSCVMSSRSQATLLNVDGGVAPMGMIISRGGGGVCFVLRPSFCPSVRLPSSYTPTSPTPFCSYFENTDYFGYIHIFFVYCTLIIFVFVVVNVVFVGCVCVCGRGCGCGCCCCCFCDRGGLESFSRWTTARASSSRSFKTRMGGIWPLGKNALNSVSLTRKSSLSGAVSLAAVHLRCAIVCHSRMCLITFRFLEEAAG